MKQAISTSFLLFFWAFFSFGQNDSLVKKRFTNALFIGFAGASGTTSINCELNFRLARNVMGFVRLGIAAKIIQGEIWYSFKAPIIPMQFGASIPIKFKAKSDINFYTEAGGGYSKSYPDEDYYYASLAFKALFYNKLFARISLYPYVKPVKREYSPKYLIPSFFGIDTENIQYSLNSSPTLIGIDVGINF